MTATCALQATMIGGSRHYARSLREALRDPAAAQYRVLRRNLRANANTAFGNQHDFSSIRTPAEFQRAVPLRDYDELVPWIDRIRAGETRVLTSDRVTRFVPSSGSAAASKLIPWTKALRSEFVRASGGWMVDLFERYPGLCGGLAYWSISPAVPFRPSVPSKVPIGFADDTAYLGDRLGAAMRSTLAVPPMIAAIRDLDAFRYMTALALLRARKLALVSVWHPSFLSLLLAAMADRWDELLRDVRSGRPSVELDEPFRHAFNARSDPRRADELASAGPGAWTEIWPRLALVSCWADAHAAGAFRELRAMLPGVEFQAKGLLATEAFVTLPFAGGRPVAALSHFFEFLDGQARARLLHDLVEDEEYSVAVTTGGGLYRYRLRDRVRVCGFVERTPSLHFIGKEDKLSDRFGEKLDDGFVAHVLDECLSGAPGPDFAMLAPDERGTEVGYTLYVQAGHADVAHLASAMDHALSANPHYRYSRHLGQLGSVRVFIIDHGAHAAYLAHRNASGQQLGNIKPAALSAESGWSSRFKGRYVICSSANNLPRNIPPDPGGAYAG